MAPFSTFLYPLGPLKCLQPIPSPLLGEPASCPHRGLQLKILRQGDSGQYFTLQSSGDLVQHLLLLCEGKDPRVTVRSRLLLKKASAVCTVNPYICSFKQGGV